MQMPTLATAVLAAALAAKPSEACRCGPSAPARRLDTEPESAKVQVLVRFLRWVPSDAAHPTGPAWVEVETKPLRGAGFSRYRWGGSSCDVRLPHEGWFLLLSDTDPEVGFSTCTSSVIPVEEAGPLLERLRRKATPRGKR
jgi:hypothetical protein